MTEEAKLKLCPCCGGEAVCSNRGTRFYGVFCASNDGECFCETTGHTRKKDAIAAWNHRPFEDAEFARVAKMKEAGEKMVALLEPMVFDDLVCRAIKLWRNACPMK